MIALIFALLIFVLFLKRNAYELSLQIAEERCNFIALASDEIDLASDKIDCSVVQDDIFLRLWVSKTTEHYVECAHGDFFWFQEPPMSCELLPGPNSRNDDLNRTP